MTSWRQLSVLVLAACGGGENAPTMMQVVDSAGLRIATATAPPAAVPEWRLAATPLLTLSGTGPADSAAFALVGPVRWLAGGQIVVADIGASRLLVFDSSGAFQRSFGRRGEGPAEFQRLATVTPFAGDSLAAFDPVLRRVSVWHPDQGFVRSTLLAGESSLEDFPIEAWPWQDTLLVVMHLAVTPLEAVPTSTGLRRWPQRAYLTLRDGRGRLLRRSPQFDGTYTGLEARGDRGLPFSNRPFAALAPDRVYFGSGTPFTLSYLNAAFVPEGEVRWPAQEELLTPAEVEEVRSDLRALVASRLPPERLTRAFTKEFSPEILPEYRPAIGRVLVDPAGRVWVERFEATRFGTLLQKPGDRWTVLTADGRPLARLRLPPSSRLEAVRDDRVVVVRWDSREVQTIAVHSLVR
jgi:hypothetical protein